MRIAFLAVLCASHLAVADTPKDRAAKLFEEGRELAKVASYAEACDRFAKSYELDPAPGTGVNFADCQEHLGHLARAWQLFDASAARADREQNAVRAQYARDRANALLPRLGTLVIKVGDHRFDRLNITIGDRSVMPAAEIHDRVEPGDVEIVVAAPEQRFVTTAHASAGVTTTVEVPMLGLDAGHRRHSWVVAAAATGAAGVASLAISGVLGLSAARYYNDAFTHGQCFYTASGDQCTPAGLATVESAHTRANVGTAMFIGGLALVTTSVALYWFAPREHAVEVLPAVSSTGASVSLSTRF